MKTIGVRNLKATLSSVLRDVQRGDIYLVTDRGRVVAELRSPAAYDQPLSDEDRAMARLAASGHLRVSERAMAVYPASPLRSDDGLAASILDEGRGE
jgi:antitoxin (DNA-binding transcriptional repressor) of toxin-antitoxin stability system